MICGHDKTKRIQDAAWQAYCAVQDVIDALENIGLTVEDGTMENAGYARASSLYAATTAAGTAVLETFNVPVHGVQGDEGFMILAHVDKEGRKSKSVPDKTTRALMDLADTAEKKGIHLSKGMRQYEVTVAMTGGISVYAESEDRARGIVDGMATDEIMEKAAWDSPSATDAYPNP